MTLIPSDIADCVIYLYPSEGEAYEGRKIGGSGFLVDVPGRLNPSRRILLAVTNKHVADNNSAVRLNTQAGDMDVIALDSVKQNWIPHPDGDDLAASLISLDAVHHKFSSVPIELFLRENSHPLPHIGLGSDVFMVGRYIDHEGKQKNNPTVRFGHLAQMAGDPIKSSTGESHISYLVESFSVDGYSGSPVFTWFGPLPAMQKVMGLTPNPIANGPFLLGIQWGHMFLREYLRDKSDERFKDEKKDWHVRVHPGLSCVCPSYRAVRLFDCEELMSVIEAAEKDEHERLENRGGAMPASVPPASDANPKHREDFKSLLDAAAKKPPQAD